MTIVPAGPPLEPQHQPIGRRSGLLVDASRTDRALGVDCWYPAATAGGDPSVYELLPGVGFTASAGSDRAVAAGSHPLIVWSHGRTGTRNAYVMLCEGLAARGYVVVAPDHPGDTLADWLLGSAVDDETNSLQRIDDLRFVLDAVLAGTSGVIDADAIDRRRVAVAGHSYGGFSAFGLVGHETGDDRVAAVAGLQSLTRTLPKTVLQRVEVPVLLVAGARDATTPPATDADRAFALFGSRDLRRVDIAAAGHQACSDVGLYRELAPTIEGLPAMVGDYLESMADNVTGTAGDPWRPTVGLHLRLLGAWLDEVLERDAATEPFPAVAAGPGITLAKRP